MPSLQEMGALLEQARAIAVKYHALTGLSAEEGSTPLFAAFQTG